MEWTESTWQDAALSALRQWDDFPADKVPRPTVLIGPRVTITGRFVDAETKLAFMARKIDLRPDVDAELAQLLMAGKTSIGHRRHALRLTHTAVAESDCTVRTDRGPGRLPGWSITLTGLDGHVNVVKSGEWWPGDTLDGTQLTVLKATVAAEGTHLVVDFVGPNVSQRTPQLRYLESPNAVAVVPVEPTSLSTRSGLRFSSAHHERAALTLNRPLGGRVLVRPDGTAAPVEELLENDRRVARN